SLLHPLSISSTALPHLSALVLLPLTSLVPFFFNHTATTHIYTLSLHDALPIFCCDWPRDASPVWLVRPAPPACVLWLDVPLVPRSEEHTSELQSHLNLVCRLLLEKKKNTVTVATADQLDIVTAHVAKGRPVVEC